MNDEKFELTISDLAGSGTYYADIADELRARDTAQREALARVEAEHEANRLELGEALILIGQVLDCRTLEDLNPVRRYLNEFMDRYSLRPVPDVDLVQAEQQEAQSAQAGDEREAFEAWHRGRFGTKSQTGDPTRDMHNGVKAEEYGPEEQQIRWECWQARAARATQPAAGEPEALSEEAMSTIVGMVELCLERRYCMGMDEGFKSFEPEVEHDFVKELRAFVDGAGKFPAAPPAAAHGDEAPGTVRVTAAWLQKVHRDLDACQKVIWLAGCGPRGYGFDPAYCEGAQARLKEIDEHIARAPGDGEVSRG